MKITDFKKGDKFTKGNWKIKEPIHFDKDGIACYEDLNRFVISYDRLMADDWELYQEPEKEKKVQTWYQVVSQNKGFERPELEKQLYENLEHFYYVNDTELADYEFEPKLINPIEVEYE